MSPLLNWPAQSPAESHLAQSQLLDALNDGIGKRVILD
jgi:hypothetical protein